MGPTETRSAAAPAAETLNELLHPVPGLLGLRLQLLLHAVHLRLDRLLNLRAEPGRPGLGVLAVRLERALRLLRCSLRKRAASLRRLRTTRLAAFRRLRSSRSTRLRATVPRRSNRRTSRRTRFSSRSALGRLVQGWIASTTRSRTSRAAPTGTRSALSADAAYLGQDALGLLGLGGYPLRGSCADRPLAAVVRRRAVWRLRVAWPRLAAALRCARAAAVLPVGRACACAWLRFVAALRVAREADVSVLPYWLRLLRGSRVTNLHLSYPESNRTNICLSRGRRKVTARPWKPAFLRRLWKARYGARAIFRV